MQRYELTEEHFERLRPFLPVQKRGGRWADHRRVVNGIFWILFSGAPWRDLPDRYGPWQTAHRRLHAWRKAGVWGRMLRELRLTADRHGLLDYSRYYADTTSVRATRAAGGARKKTASNASA